MQNCQNNLFWEGVLAQTPWRWSLSLGGIYSIASEVRKPARSLFRVCALPSAPARDADPATRCITGTVQWIDDTRCYMWMHIIVMETQFYAKLVYRVRRSRIAKLYHAGQRSLLRQHKSIGRRGPLRSCSWFVFVSFSKKICSWTITRVRQNRNDGGMLRASRVSRASSSDVVNAGLHHSGTSAAGRGQKSCQVMLGNNRARCEKQPRTRLFFFFLRNALCLRQPHARRVRLRLARSRQLIHAAAVRVCPSSVLWPIRCPHSPFL